MVVHGRNEKVELLEMKVGEGISCNVRTTGGVAGREGEAINARGVSEAAKQVHEAGPEDRAEPVLRTATTATTLLLLHRNCTWRRLPKVEQQ